jgi:hypothetical protein
MSDVRRHAGHALRRDDLHAAPEPSIARRCKGVAHGASQATDVIEAPIAQAHDDLPRRIVLGVRSDCTADALSPAIMRVLGMGRRYGSSKEC